MTIIEKYEPSIIGFQEVLYDQYLFFIKHLHNAYFYFGIGREDGERIGEFNPIYVKKDDFYLVKKGVFWLSDTPHKPSKTWEGCCYRICTWVEIGQRGSSKPNFLVANTHFDEKFTNTRKKSIVVLKENLVAHNKPLILMGDFNFTREDPEYNIILGELQLKDSFLEAYRGNNVRNLVTYHGYSGTKYASDSPRFIDYIFTSSKHGLHAEGSEIIYLNEGGKKSAYPSDHWPVLVNFLTK